MGTNSGMRITELAARIGTTPRAVRYYEEIGLVVPMRSEGQARVYNPEVRNRLQQIVRLRHLGMSTRDIANYLAQAEDGAIGRARVRKILVQKLRLLDSQRERLAKEIQNLASGLG